MKRTCWYCLSTVLVLLLLYGVGCGVNPNAPRGATVGGAQDIGYARNLIEAGQVPEAEYIVAEGLFSEHDIPTPQEECTDPLCLSLGYGVAPGIDDESQDLFIHLGFTTSITPEEFTRPDLQLALVIDRSGSMEGGSLDAVKDALETLVPKLTSRDHVSLFQFDNVSERVMGTRRMDAAGKEALLDAIDELDTRGGTDIERGITDGYEELDRLDDLPGVSKRLMLFTDAMPNVGATDQNSFRQITSTYADRGIGLTAFGVGLDFGQELTYHISRLRGGNFFFLRNEERIRKVFTEEFDLLVTPIVYDLQVSIPNPPGARLKQIYGLPDQDSGAAEVTLEIPTLFFSTNRGAIILRYTQEGGDYAVGSGEEIVGGTIRYVKTDQGHVSSQEKVVHTAGAVGPTDTYFSGDGTRLGVALTNVYLGLHGACRLFHEGDRDGALALLDRAIDRTTTENLILANPGLQTEIALMQKLRENVEKN